MFCSAEFFKVAGIFFLHCSSKHLDLQYLQGFHVFNVPARCPPPADAFSTTSFLYHLGVPLLILALTPVAGYLTFITPLLNFFDPT